VTGDEEPDHPGIFYARVPGTDIAILYTVDVDANRIYLAGVGDER
jgi:hypothetical protein